jgi:hypothetical protein
MRDVERKHLERSRPQVPPLKAINHCLACLFDDEQHAASDKVVDKLTYEELIGALLLARDLAEDAGRSYSSYD